MKNGISLEHLLSWQAILKKLLIQARTLLFKLSEVHSLYVERLEDLGMKKKINKTRLKKDLFQHFPESQEQQEGKSTIIVFKEGMKNMLKEALKERNFKEDALILARAARMTYWIMKALNSLVVFNITVKKILYLQV